MAAFDDESTHLDAALAQSLVGGFEPGVVHLVEYDPAWPERFEVERSRILSALGQRARRIEHIGSTSVPGLVAKPIIDVVVELDDPEDDASYQSLLESAGFVLRVREPRHRMYQTPECDVHVHVWPIESAEVAEYLLLRDWLRSHADDCRLYAETKHALAGREWRDANYYAEAKGPVIDQIKARARASL
jgi:GrpB-like predicted nucleotidyltransferase (UPF0157 family)